MVLESQLWTRPSCRNIDLRRFTQVNFPSQHVQFQEGFSLSTIYFYPGLAYVRKRSGFYINCQHFYLNHAFHARIVTHTHQDPWGGYRHHFEFVRGRGTHQDQDQVRKCHWRRRGAITSSRSPTAPSRAGWGQKIQARWPRGLVQSNMPGDFVKNLIQPCDADCLYCFDFNPLDVYNKTERRSWNHSCEQGLRAEISTLEDSS